MQVLCILIFRMLLKPGAALAKQIYKKYKLAKPESMLFGSCSLQTYLAKIPFSSYIFMASVGLFQMSSCYVLHYFL